MDAVPWRMRVDTTLMTLEEYANLDEPDERWVSELVRGVLVREPRPQDPHGHVQVLVAYALQGWARNVGARVTLESGYILSENPPTLRGPDVAVVLERRSSEGQPGGWVRGAPDLAVEVLSPSDTSSAMQEKMLDYLNAGAKRVWLVDPGARTVTVFRPDGSAQMLRAHDTLGGEDVLVGFSVPLSELFEDV
jgi:Uma2 family endonuclease